jgi:hypothetical protein
VYKDGNTAFIVCRNGHIKNMDTSVWGPDTDGISRVSAQEDTVVHRVYMAVKIKETIYDDVQRHSGDSVAQQTMGSVAPYLLRSVLMRIPLLTLASRVMR